MSIIYDALKKVKIDGPDGKSALPKAKSLNPKAFRYAAYIFAISLGFICAYMFSKLISGNLNLPLQKETPQIAVLPPVAIKPEEFKPSPAADALAVETKKPDKPLFSLNGLFFSGKEGYAIINNQVVRVGDIVEGALVRRITLAGVDLDFEGKELNLSNK